MAYINDMKAEEYINSKCPNCGSTLVFLAGSRQTQCVSCDSTFEITSLGTGKLDHLETDYFQTINELVKQNQEQDYVRRSELNALQEQIKELANSIKGSGSE